MVSFIEVGVNLILQFISISGYFSVFFLMMLESAFLPVPSEVVMPFSGYLVWKGEFNFWYTVLAGTIGNVVGSIIAYLIGLYIGREFIVKYGKYLLLKEKYVNLTERWFHDYGNKAIFFSRLLPVVRTVISLPAGIGKMDFKKFIIYTFVGSLPWCYALTYFGVMLENRWMVIFNYGHALDFVVVLGLGVFIVWHIQHRRDNRRKWKDYWKN